MQRAALAQRHAHDAALGGFRRLADRLRHFARLAVAEADAALLVADDDERGEAEAAAALHHLRHAVDVDEAIDEFAVALLALCGRGRGRLPFTRHCLFPSLKSRRAPSGAARFRWSSELEAALAGALGERLDAAVIHVAAAVEHDLGDAGLLRPLGELLADGRAASTVAPVLSCSRIAFSSDEAAASVRPCSSSMTCA